MNWISYLLLSFSFVLFHAHPLLAQWEQTNGPGGGFVLSLAKGESYVYAGTNNGVFRSADNGESWVPANGGIARQSIRYLATREGRVFAGSISRLFRSDNHGDTWAVCDEGIANSWFLSLLATDEVLLAGTNGGGVFRSSDDGASWAPANEGLTNLAVHSLATNGAAILAGTGQGLFRSMDNGITWSKVETSWSIKVDALAYRGTDIFVGSDFGTILHSPDDGATWAGINPGAIPYQIINALAVSGDYLIVGSTFGILRYLFDGTTWSQIGGILLKVFGMAALISDQEVIIGAREGAFRSSDHGLTWDFSSNGLTNTWVTALAPSGQRLFVGTMHSGNSWSTDDGETWNLSTAGITSPTTYAFAHSGSYLFAGTQDGAVSLGIIYNGGIFRSDDQGTSWQVSRPGISVSSMVAREADIFAASNSGRVFHSADNGESWVVISDGLPNSWLHALLYNGTDVYVGTASQGVFRYLETFNYWEPFNEGLQTKINALAAQGSSLFAGTENGLFRTANDSSSWARVNESLINVPVYTLAANETAVFAGTREGVFVSADEGESWAAINEGLSDFDIRALALHGDYLFVGTSRSGVWRFPLEELILVQEKQPVAEAALAILFQNHPNPIQETTTIGFYLPAASRVSLKVFDVSGREVATLLSGEFTAGTHSREWGAAGLPNGVYFYCLQAGAYKETKKLVVLRQ